MTNKYKTILLYWPTRKPLWYKHKIQLLELNQNFWYKTYFQRFRACLWWPTKVNDFKLSSTLQRGRFFRVNNNIFEFFRTNNAQATSLFSNVTSRRMKLMWWNSFWQQCPSSVKWYIPFDWRRALLPETVSYHQFRASACYVEKEGGSLCIVCTKKLGYVHQLPVAP